MRELHVGVAGHEAELILQTVSSDQQHRLEIGTLPEILHDLQRL